jgi:hypothetical protein
MHPASGGSVRDRAAGTPLEGHHHVVRLPGLVADERRPIPAAAAEALHISPSPSNKELAAAFNGLDGAPSPKRPETQSLLGAIARQAFGEMPGAGVPWEDAHFIHSSSYALREAADDDLVVAIAAADLGLLGVIPKHSYDWWAPKHALQENLEVRIITLLHLLAERMIDAGAVPDWSGEPRV